MKHENFQDFTTGRARDGPPLPKVDDGFHAITILIVPVLLGYIDLGSDLYCGVLLPIGPPDLVCARPLLHPSRRTSCPLFPSPSLQ